MCLVVGLVVIGLLFLFGFLATVGFVVALIPWLFVGLIVGAIASALTHSRHGLLGDIFIGLAGSVVGGALFSFLFHVGRGGLFSIRGILAAIVGSVILLLIGKTFSHRF